MKVQNAASWCIILSCMYLATADIERKDSQHRGQFVKHQTRRQLKSSTYNDNPSEFPDAWRVYEDNHTYYSSHIYKSSALVNVLWIDLDDTNIHQNLSDRYRGAANFKLPFTFKFYGHDVTNVVIATGGFLYMGDFVHQHISSAQYIAPLMANFDLSIGGNQSLILYKTLHSKLVIEWRDVYLQERGSYSEPFSFQCILFPNGTIIFLYLKVPSRMEEISDINHPVKVGLSDAYYVVSSIFGVSKKTVYEYHRVTIKPTFIQEGTVIVLTPLPTCNMATDCETCLSQRAPDSNYTCQWCPTLGRCSDGWDRLRDEWLRKCSDTNILGVCTHTGPDLVDTTVPQVGKTNTWIVNVTDTADNLNLVAIVIPVVAVVAAIPVVVFIVIYVRRRRHPSNAKPVSSASVRITKNGDQTKAYEEVPQSENHELSSNLPKEKESESQTCEISSDLPEEYKNIQTQPEINFVDDTNSPLGSATTPERSEC